MRESWAYASTRELWQNPNRKRIEKNRMSDKPLIKQGFVNYMESLAVIAHYIARTRETVADCILRSHFPKSIIEAVCICKFVGTSFGVDAVSATRKIMGTRAVQEESRLGAPSFVCNCTCAAEGDNTIMELKVVGDLFKGGFKTIFPIGLLFRALLFSGPLMRWVAVCYLWYVLKAMWMQKKALGDGQLLRDIAWCRAHLIIIDTFLRHGASTYGEENVKNMLESYATILVRFPTPVQY